MANILTEAQVCYSRIENCINNNDKILLSLTLPLLNQFHSLFCRLNSFPTNPDVSSLLSEIITISSNLKEAASLILQQSEDIVEHCSVSLSQVTSSGNGLGRPKLDIPQNEVIELRNAGLSWNKIAKFYNVSKDTIHRRRNYMYLGERSRRSEISDEALLQIITEIKHENPNAGYVYMWSNLKARNIFITWSRLLRCMRAVDPVGILYRSRRRLTRRKYKVKGANYLW